MGRPISSILAIAAIVGVVSFPTAGIAQTAPPFKTGDTSKGSVFTDAKGMSLYTRDTDPAGKSGCNAQCATLWPPIIAPADASANGDWSVITRDDGSKQWAYKGKPVYDFARDTKAGDVTGDGFANNVWHLAHP